MDTKRILATCSLSRPDVFLDERSDRLTRGRQSGRMLIGGAICAEKSGHLRIPRGPREHDAGRGKPAKVEHEPITQTNLNSVAISGEFVTLPARPPVEYILKKWRNDQIWT
ncbi:unnamed protein product, partial [Iphiclides podalirius]